MKMCFVTSKPLIIQRILENSILSSPLTSLKVPIDPMKKVILTRDGLMFLIMGYRGEEAARRKEMFIAAFNAMEKKLMAMPSMSKIQMLAAMASEMEKQETKLLEIDAIKNFMSKGAPNFRHVEIIDKNAIGGDVNKSCYTMDRDGFTVLAMGFEGDKALKFKAGLHRRF